MKQTASNYSIGDRESPLEANPELDIVRTDPLVDQNCEVSPYAGGTVSSLISKGGKVTGVVRRLGRLVGYEVEIEKKSYVTSIKDLYVNRQILEDVQVMSPMACAIKETLSHWDKQHEYWGPCIDGIEALCFELASLTPIAKIEVNSNGFQFLIPEPMGGRTIVDCFVRIHENYWTMMAAVYSERESVPNPPEALLDHWARTLSWTYEITRQMNQDWAEAVRKLEQRAQITAQILRPLMMNSLTRALAKQQELKGDVPHVPSNGVSIGMSSVRLQPRTVGLTEPPTDRRPYTVMSISPDVVIKGKDYLRQVVLHECVHVVVGIRGGPPHNEDFKRLAQAVGLEPKHSH